MANPQKENGYTPISNELLDEIIMFGFVATHYKIVLCCLRYSYGFSRKDAELSESYLAKATNISKRYISQELNKLIDMKVVTVIKESTYSSARIICINKNYEEWESRTTVPQANHSSTDEPEQDTTVEPELNTTVEPQVDSIKQNIKQNIKQVPKKQNKRKKKIFVKPTIPEIQAYCDERKNGIDAEYFFSYYETRDWIMSNGKKMHNWQMAVITWEKNKSRYGNANGYNQPTLFKPPTAEVKKDEPMKPQRVNYQSRE